MAEHNLLAEVQQAFENRFQTAPEIIVRAPGRVNLIGEHTDYNNGFVLPVAVDRAAWLAAARAEEPWATIRAVNMRNDEAIFTVENTPASVGGWADYPKSIVWAFLERNLQPVGLNAVLTSDVPVGAGMSSSAAIELAFAYAWAELGGFHIEPTALAQLCQQAENEYVGVNCGIMDQMICASGKAGHAMLLDTREMKHRYVPIPPGLALVVADSQVRRSLANSAYNARRGECEQAVSILKQHRPDITSLRDVTFKDLQQYGRHLPETIFRRARHVITENQRVLRMAKALYEKQVEEVGAILGEGHRSLRDDYEVSIPELDTLVEAAVEVEGCYGARLTGAGFGGCILALVAEEVVDEVIQHISEVYDAQFGSRPPAYVTHPADGVSRVG